MNLSRTEAIRLSSEIRQGLGNFKKENVQVMLFVPSLYLEAVTAEISGLPFLFAGAQNSAAWKEGAYTGEVSAYQIASSGVAHTLIGHSERRTLFGETDEVLKTKIDLALEAGLKPVFCCGEPRDIRESGQHEELVCAQIRNALFHLSEEQIRKVIIAYEPVWAIGTGLTASAAQAQEMHACIRMLLAAQYGQEVADSISILYGGSMKASNAAELLAMPDVDGGLIGGASLVSAEFLKIVECA